MPKEEEERQLGTATSTFRPGSALQGALWSGITGLLAMKLKHESKKSEKMKAKHWGKQKKIENTVSKRPGFPVQSRNF